MKYDNNNTDVQPALTVTLKWGESDTLLRVRVRTRVRAAAGQLLDASDEAAEPTEPHSLFDFIQTPTRAV